jgi:hypothetical protein
MEADWFHFMKEHFEMGWKLCTTSPQLHFWRVGASILKVFLDCEKWPKNLYAIEEPPTTSRWMGKSLLQMFAKTC